MSLLLSADEVRELTGLTRYSAQGGNATALLGHPSAKMTERYLRDKVVPVVAGPSFVIPIRREKKSA